jgi:hypothetical protein
MRKLICLVVAVVLIGAVPAVAAPLEQERMERSWVEVVRGWVEAMVGAVLGPPAPAAPPEQSNGGGEGDSGPEIDPGG